MTMSKSLNNQNSHGKISSQLTTLQQDASFGQKDSILHTDILLFSAYQYNTTNR